MTRRWSHLVARATSRQPFGCRNSLLHPLALKIWWADLCRLLPARSRGKENRPLGRPPPRLLPQVHLRWRILYHNPDQKSTRTPGRRKKAQVLPPESFPLLYKCGNGYDARKLPPDFVKQLASLAPPNKKSSLTYPLKLDRIRKNMPPSFLIWHQSIWRGAGGWQAERKTAARELDGFASA